MNGKLLAIGMVAVMMVAGLAMLPAGNESDAAVGDGGSYTYVLTYDSSQMSAQWDVSTALSVADMDAIYHPSYDGTTTTGYGDWTWDATTGLGPFNSFYGAFDINNANAFVAVLDPFDLTHGIDGTDYTSQRLNLNIMWVLPTVYWKTDSTHVYITNVPGSDTDYKAYAHTINGHIYNYIAIGVYEAIASYTGGSTKLLSLSGSTPTNNQTLSNYRNAAHAYGTDGELNSSLTTDPSNPAYGMVWNFYQWELYKLCALTVMENFNAQNTVGNGKVYGSSSGLTTGATNSMGPYAGNPGLITDGTTGTSYGSNSVKLFIENAWGDIRDNVDGIVVDGTQGLYIDTKSTPDDSTTTSDYVTYKSATLSSGYGTAIFTDAEIWGLTSSGSGTSTTGTTDSCFSPSSSGSYHMSAGGYSYSNVSDSVQYGISFVNAVEPLTANSSGARLAFVFDANLIQNTVTLTTDGSGYGSLDGTTSFEVDPGSTITISGDTVTVGTDTVTAEPLSNTTQYTYAFENWTIDDTPVTGTYTVDADTTLVANFSRTTNTYAVTITAGEGGSVSDSSIANVPYGTTWSTSGDTLTVGSDTVTAIPDAATAQYTYSVDAWSPASGTVEGATAISVSFTATLNSYTITYVVSGESSSETLDYGETPDPDDPVAPEGYRFYRWDPAIVPVTGNATYTAVFVEEGSTVIVLDPAGGSVGTTTIYATQGQPIGELPTPTRMGFDFDGWFTAAEGGVEVTADTIVTEDMTIYAHWEITSTWNTYKILVYAMITLLFIGIAVAILRNYVGGDRF